MMCPTCQSSNPEDRRNIQGPTIPEQILCPDPWHPANRPAPAQLVPKCVHCKADPIQFAFVPAAFGEYLIGTVFCAACRATIGTVLLGLKQPGLIQ